MREIIAQQLRWDEKTNRCYLNTLYRDETGNKVLSEPLTSEEASQWQAEHGY